MTRRVTLHICPPTYPEGFEPFACKHPPEMQICDARIDWMPRGRGDIVVSCARCLACGAPVGTGARHNIFLDIANLRSLDIGTSGPIRRRLDQMQRIYLLRAEILFGPEGWRGDEAWRDLSEIIDPALTMRVCHAGAHGDSTRFLRVICDDPYQFKDPQDAPAGDLFEWSNTA